METLSGLRRGHVVEAVGITAADCSSPNHGRTLACLRRSLACEEDACLLAKDACLLAEIPDMSKGWPAHRCRMRIGRSVTTML